MKNTKEEKQKLRRYLDDIYTRNEASQLLDSLRDAENKDLLEEVTAEVWEASADHGRTTSAEREEYKKEARQLLQSLEHGKRIWFRRSAYAIASIAALLCLVFGSGRAVFVNPWQGNLGGATVITFPCLGKRFALIGGS